MNTRTLLILSLLLLGSSLTQAKSSTSGKDTAQLQVSFSIKRSAIRYCYEWVDFKDSTLLIDTISGEHCVDSDSIICDSIIRYEWSFGDGSMISNDKNPRHLFTSYDTFKIKLKVYTKFGQVDSLVKSFFKPGPRPYFEIYNKPRLLDEDTIFLCEGDLLSLKNRSIEPSENPVWDIHWGDGRRGAFTSPVGRATYQYTKPGTYFLYLQMEDEIPGTAVKCEQFYPDTSTAHGKKLRKIHVIVKPTPKAKISVSKQDLAIDEKVKFSVSLDSAYDFYTFYFGNGDSITLRSNDTTFEYGYSESGRYKVQFIPHLKNQIGRYQCVDSTNIEIRVGTVNVFASSQSNIKVFPNPATENLTLKFEHKDIQWQTVALTNTLGKLVYSENLPTNKNEHQIRFPILAPGIYTLSLNSANRTSVHKVVIAK